MHARIDDAQAGFQGVRVDLFVGMDLAQLISQSWALLCGHERDVDLVEAVDDDGARCAHPGVVGQVVDFGDDGAVLVAKDRSEQQRGERAGVDHDHLIPSDLPLSSLA